ncbi:hypothetical protein ACOSQ2_026779 [Xanthoceras sorbifolium]
MSGRQGPFDQTNQPRSFSWRYPKSVVRVRVLWVVQELDEGATGDYLKKFPHVRVLVDINKPLKRCIRIDAMGSVKETILLLHYERLLKHFFSYGMLGYLVQECPDDEIGVPRVSSECYPYGSWLRASSPVKMLASRSHREDNTSTLPSSRSAEI